MLSQEERRSQVRARLQFLSDIHQFDMRILSDEQTGEMIHVLQTKFNPEGFISELLFDYEEAIPVSSHETYWVRDFIHRQQNVTLCLMAGWKNWVAVEITLGGWATSLLGFANAIGISTSEYFVTNGERTHVCYQDHEDVIQVTGEIAVEWLRTRKHHIFTLMDIAPAPLLLHAVELSTNDDQLTLEISSAESSHYLIKFERPAFFDLSTNASTHNVNKLRYLVLGLHGFNASSHIATIQSNSIQAAFTYKDVEVKRS